MKKNQQKKNQTDSLSFESSENQVLNQQSEEVSQPINTPIGDQQNQNQTPEKNLPGQVLNQEFINSINQILSKEFPSSDIDSFWDKSGFTMLDIQEWVTNM